MKFVILGVALGNDVKNKV